MLSIQKEVYKKYTITNVHTLLGNTHMTLQAFRSESEEIKL